MRCCRSTICRSSATCSSRDRAGTGLAPADRALDPAVLPGRDGCWAVRGLLGCVSMMSYHSSSVPYGSMRAWQRSCLARQHLLGAEGQQLLRVLTTAAHRCGRAADELQEAAAPRVLGSPQVMCVFRRLRSHRAIASKSAPLIAHIVGLNPSAVPCNAVISGIRDVDLRDLPR
jgi:hypothetical protein